MVDVILPRTGIELGTGRSVCQRLTHRATGAPGTDGRKTNAITYYIWTALIM